MPHIQLSEITLYYEIYGAGEPVLFLHGLGSSTEDWEFQRDVFAANYQVVLVDVRGHGRSQKPPGPYNVPLMMQDIIALIKALDLGVVNVVGLSMGGMIGLQLALDAPYLVKRLVVINAVADLVPKSLREHFMVWQRLTIVRLFNMRGMGKFLAKKLFPLASQARARPIFVERWAKNDKAAYIAAFKGLVGWSVLDRLANIKCPVLFLAAEFDYSDVVGKETAVSRIPNATLQIIPNSRHASTVDAPDVVNEAMLTFLGNQQKRMKKLFPHAIHTVLITFVLDKKADDFLRAIVDLSKESEFYSHDSIIAGYEHTGALHFEFLDTPLLFRYTIGGYPYELQTKNFEQSQCVLYDLGNFSEDMEVPDSYFEKHVHETEQLNLPMVYFIYGTKDIQMDTLKLKLRLERPENLMVFDSSDSDSLKKILKKIASVAFIAKI